VEKTNNLLSKANTKTPIWLKKPKKNTCMWRQHTSSSGSLSINGRFKDIDEPKKSMHTNNIVISVLFHCSLC